MKEEKMLRAFSLVDDELVENAAPKEQKPKTPLWWKRIAYVAVAACLSLAVILPIAFMGGGSGSVPVLSSDSAGQNVGTPASPGATTASPAFDAPGATVGGIVNPSPTPSNPVGTTGNTAITTMPVPSDTELIEGVDQNKEYLPLYEMLSAYISESKIDLPPAQPTAPDIAPGGVTTDFSGNLTGADAIQKTDTHIFCLKDNKIEAYVRSGDGFLCVGAFEVGDKSELYLLDGGKKMLLIGSSSLWTRLLLLDVRDPTCMKELRRVRITGKLNSHAMTEDGFVVATNYTVWEAPDYDNPTSFVPYLQVDGGAANHLAMQDIIIPPDKALGLDYAVTYSFDAETLTLQSRRRFWARERQRLPKITCSFARGTIAILPTRRGCAAISIALTSKTAD